MHFLWKSMNFHERRGSRRFQFTGTCYEKLTQSVQAPQLDTTQSTGQNIVLQSRQFVRFGHCVPTSLFMVTILRERSFVPPAHVLVHTDQRVHSETSQ